MSGDEQLDDRELRGVGLLVLGAGFETTVNLIGNAVVQLDAHPDQLAVVRERPELLARCHRGGAALRLPGADDTCARRYARRRASAGTW